MTFADSLVDLPCDLCETKQEEFLYVKEGVLTHHPFRIVRCRKCGFIYINPKLSATATSELYDGSYYDGRGFDRGGARYISEYDTFAGNGSTRQEELVKIVADLVPPPAKLLDFGCGLGGLVHKAKQYGYEAEGFEVSSFAADFGKKNGLRIYSSVDAIPSDKYDIVVAIDVLEHCFSTTQSFNAIHRILKKKGVLYHNTENFDGIYEKWKRGKDITILDQYLIPEGHINAFSTPVMVAYFTKCGFSKSFPFEPKVYQKETRIFKFLNKLKLLDASADRPTKWYEKILYYGGRSMLTKLGARNPRLPLAVK